MKKLRLLVTKDCNRSCPGCCNQEWDLDSLPQYEWEANYDEILLTGGEPLLYIRELKELIYDLRVNSWAKIFVYTACADRVVFDLILKDVDGMTLTLHDQEDVLDFIELNTALGFWDEAKTKSLRLNVFNNVVIPDWVNLDLWKVKRMDWINNCPLPQDEVFKQWIIG